MAESTPYDPMDLESDLDFNDPHMGLGLFSEPTKPSLTIPLTSENTGYKLLQKLGWSEGKGLGKNLQGRVDPIPISHKTDTWGVGKDTQMNEAHAESTGKRKTLESEVIAVETEEMRLKREMKVIREESIKEEIKSVTAAFYCSICDKQYAKVSEYETHLSSYDHHHRKRFKEMQDLQKSNPTQTKKRKEREEKERAQEEKELRRLQEAALAKAQSIPTVSPTAAPLIKPPTQKVAFSFGGPKPAGGGIKFSLNKK
ncbi:G patch domain-containing protein 8 [Dinochytrium kinnereticum]|nr:G patch domain-containing protein 8 [Dinochytrium kinnereticum]